MVDDQTVGGPVSDADIDRMAEALQRADDLGPDDVGRLVQRLGLAQRSDRDETVSNQSSFADFLLRLGLNVLAVAVRGLAQAAWVALREAIRGLF